LHPLPPYEESALLRALAAGDRPAYTQLYSGYLDSLTQWLFLFTGSKETAEEITQDTFLKIWEKRSTLAGVQSFKAYLFRAAKNQLINHIRRQQVHAKTLDHIRQQSDTEANNLDTAHQADYRQTHDLVRQAIEKLTKKRKQIFLASTEEGLSLDEIAARMGITKNVVKKQLYEAYDFVREYLTTHGELSAILILFLTLLQA
jgi:RNA polymerase sigma-70 factor (family 1)